MTRLQLAVGEEENWDNPSLPKPGLEHTSQPTPQNNLSHGFSVVEGFFRFRQSEEKHSVEC